MKKSAIAVAVAAVLAAPVALADVSISGGLQAELRSVGGDGNSVRKGLYATDGGEYGSENGGNYGFLKFAATEDLGDGMKALAVYNMNIHVGDGGTNATNATAGLAAREAFVGLSAGWGTVLAGTLSSPYKSSTVGWDPMLATSLQARGNAGMSTLHNGYVGNALAYANNFGGVKVVAALVLDEGAKDNDPNATETNGKHATSFSVNAPVGPVEVAVAYINASKHSEIVSAATDNVAATKVGVKWVSGDITVAGQYEMLDKAFSATGNDTGSIMYVTGSYKMGNNTISAAYGKADKKVVDNVNDATYMMVGLTHAMSKTTSGWVGYRSSEMSAGGTKDKETSVSAGLRVNF